MPEVLYIPHTPCRCTPQSAPEHPRAPQSAPERPRAPQSAPERPRTSQSAAERPRTPQIVTESQRAPQHHLTSPTTNTSTICPRTHYTLQSKVDSYDVGGRVGVGVAPMWRSPRVLDSYLCFLLIYTLTPSKTALFDPPQICCKLQYNFTPDAKSVAYTTQICPTLC